MFKSVSKHVIIMVMVLLFQLNINSIEAAWPMFGLCRRHDGLSSHVGTNEVSSNWTYETRGSINSSPVIDANGCIYIGSDDSGLYALERDGKLKWKYETGAPISAVPAISVDGVVYLGSEDGKLLGHI